MNRNFKRVLAGLAALTLCVGVVPPSIPSVISNMAVVASAAEIPDGYTQIDDSNAIYKIEDETLYVEGLVEGTEIPKNAFSALSGRGGISINGVKNVKVGDNIASIGECAFDNCGLSSIAFPYGLEVIGDYAFSGNDKDCVISIPETVISIGRGAFGYGSSTKKEIHIAGKPESINDNAFVRSQNIYLCVPEKNVPFWIEKFGWTENQTEGDALGGHVYLDAEAPSIPDGYTQIGDSNAIYKIDGDTLYVDGEGEIPEAYFAAGNYIYSVDAFVPNPDSILTSDVKNVVIGKNISKIGREAFRYCSDITSVTFCGNTVMDHWVFHNCTSLETVNLGSTHEFECTIFDCTHPMISGVSIPNANISSISIKEPFNYEYPFASIFTEIHIDADVYKNENYRSIIEAWEKDGYCFFDTEGNQLTELEDGFRTMPNSDAKFRVNGDTLEFRVSEEKDANNIIPEMYFMEYAQLPEDVKKINAKGITDIKLGAFAYVNGIEEIYAPDAKELGEASFIGCSSIKTIDIPSVEKIGEFAFATYDDDDNEIAISSIEKITLGEKCPEGLDNAFITNTAKILIPATAYDNYKSLEANGFKFSDYDGNTLTVDIPEGYTQIWDIPNGRYSNAIYKIDGDTLYVDGLEENTKIPDIAFCGKNGGIKLPGNVTNVEISEKITSIDSQAFDSCESLKKVNMPNVDSIQSLAFSGCTSLETVSMPNITFIWRNAFAKCSNLKTVDIPKIDTLAYDTFKDVNLTTVKLGSKVLQNFESAFKDNTTAKFLIPVDAYDNYKSLEASGFKFFDEATGEALSPMEFGDYVRGIGFTLDGKIGVNLGTTEKAENFTVKCGDKTIPVIASKNGVSFYIAPKEMVKEYTIEVNGTSKTITPVDIVALYTADDAKPELEEYADLAQALADYCKAADAYFDGDETTKVELPEGYEEWNTEYLEENYKDKVSDDGNIYKTSLVLNSETAFKIYVSNPEGITVDEVNADEGEKIQIDKNTVCVKISNLGPVKAMNNSFTVNGGTFTVGGYLLKALTQTDDKELVNLCSLYGDYIGYAYDFDLEG